MDDLTRVAVRDAAIRARSLIDRVVGNGDGSSWLDQMEAGELSDDWSEDHTRAVAELIEALGECARHTRDVGVPAPVYEDQPHAGSGFVQLAQHRLPLNRKERYFTGTVLPMLVSANGFAHLHRLMSLCDLDVDVQEPTAHPLDGMQGFQFFTEYGFVESVYSDVDKARFDNCPAERTAPDVVLAGRDWLLAIEAKMYLRPTREALTRQLREQRMLLDYWTEKFALEPSRVKHVLLLPEELARARQPLDLHVVTWQQVRDAYSAVGPAYWLGVLRASLDHYQSLQSPEPRFRENAEDVLTGETIVSEHASGTLVYEWMGRGGGVTGRPLADDIARGSWRSQQYEVRREPLPKNNNWFPIRDFIGKTL